MKLYDGGEVEKADRADNMAVILTFAVIIGYIMVMPMLGFILSTAIYLFLQMLILAPPDKRNVPLFAIVAVGFTAFVFVAFRVGLQQLLPRGVIENLIGFSLLPGIFTDRSAPNETVRSGAVSRWKMIHEC